MAVGVVTGKGLGKIDGLYQMGNNYRVHLIETDAEFGCDPIKCAVRKTGLILDISEALFGDERRHQAVPHIANGGRVSIVDGEEVHRECSSASSPQ